MATSSGKSHGYLERIIDKPLERCKSTNHCNSDRQTIPETTESDLAIDPAYRLSSTLSCLSVRVQLGDHDIGRMGDDGACNPCNVTTQEGNPGLLQAIVGGLGLAEEAVDLFDCGFEGCEFTHGVRDLSCPEGIETFVEPGTVS
jgi:hypothetical protein